MLPVTTKAPHHSVKFTILTKICCSTNWKLEKFLFGVAELETLQTLHFQVFKFLLQSSCFLFNYFRDFLNNFLTAENGNQRENFKWKKIHSKCIEGKGTGEIGGKISWEEKYKNKGQVRN